MHFPIIEITTKKQSISERKRSSVDYENSTLNYFCDYYGEEYSTDERYELIKSKWMKELFRGIADVDHRFGGSITFHSKEEILKTLNEYFAQVLEKLNEEKNIDGWTKFFHLRENGNEFRGTFIIFYLNGCAYTSMQFFEDAYFYAGQTLYFGQVFDAHC